jgi:hypothetical protein
VEIIPGHRENDSGLMRKPFAFPPESLFAFSPESCSSSPRNAFRVHPGIPFALPRNPQPGNTIMDLAFQTTQAPLNSNVETPKKAIPSLHGESFSLLPSSG